MHEYSRVGLAEDMCLLFCFDSAYSLVSLLESAYFIILFLLSYWQIMSLLAHHMEGLSAHGGLSVKGLYNICLIFSMILLSCFK